MTLNNKQTKILIVGVGLFILMGLFPPWIRTFKFCDTGFEEVSNIIWIKSSPVSIESSSKYAFIGLPTTICTTSTILKFDNEIEGISLINKSTIVLIGVKIDIIRLIVQWLILIATIGLVLFWVRNKTKLTI